MAKPYLIVDSTDTSIADVDSGGGHEFNFRHEPAHHRQLHRDVIANGPVILTLGAANGLIMPLIAVHLFVFYFGILEDDTPPVGLAAFAAAAISKGNPIKTGIRGFVYDLHTALLPFLSIFNPELLPIEVTVFKAIFIFIVAVITMTLFTSATQGRFIMRNHIWESVVWLVYHAQSYLGIGRVAVGGVHSVPT